MHVADFSLNRMITLPISAVFSEILIHSSLLNIFKDTGWLEDFLYCNVL